MFSFLAGNVFNSHFSQPDLHRIRQESARKHDDGEGLKRKNSAFAFCGILQLFILLMVKAGLLGLLAGI